MKKTNIVFANPIMSRTGLGNMLITWARAEVFARDHQCPILAPRWTHWMRIGPWLRGDKDKRFYLSMFSNTGMIDGAKKMAIKILGNHVLETQLRHLEEIKNKSRRPVCVDFLGRKDFFRPFLKEHEYIKKRLFTIASRQICDEVAGFVAQTHPFIAVNIRRGDFCGTPFYTENDWFLRALDLVLSEDSRRFAKFRIVIFSDAFPEELHFITKKYPNAVLCPKIPALSQLLWMSHGERLIASAHSSFSMWAAWLGQMPNYWSKIKDPPILSENNNNFVTMLD